MQQSHGLFAIAKLLVFIHFVSVAIQNYSTLGQIFSYNENNTQQMPPLCMAFTGVYSFVVVMLVSCMSGITAYSSRTTSNGTVARLCVNINIVLSGAWKLGYTERLVYHECKIHGISSV